MYRNENIRKIVKIFIVVILCSELHSTDTQLDSYEDRILYYRHDLNGTEATFNNTKYHASIRLKEKDERYGMGHICSGALIAPSVVLTTASCVFNQLYDKPYHPSELKVVLGSLTRYQRHEQTLIYSVTHSYLAPGFDMEKLRDNLAILMLERDIPEVEDNVKPTTWPKRNTNWYDKQRQQNFKVTTWLKTYEGLFLNPLMSLDISKANENACFEYYGHLYGPGMLCMNSTGSLLQDVGSPLFVNNKLIGLMSFNEDLVSPAIYTDITYHAKWIQEKIGNGRHRNSSFWGALGFLALTLLVVRRSKFFKL